MLYFVNHYYEVTDENINQLKCLIKAEDIRDYGGHRIDVDVLVRVGRVIGNNQTKNPKRTGFWSSRHAMGEDSLKKVTTTIQRAVIIIE